MSLAVQMMAFVPVHAPAWHVSVCVHMLPSSQVKPLTWFGFEQPFTGSQVPATWHWSSAVQVTGFAPVQVPAWQVSVCVQTLPSLQPVPSGWFGFEQRPDVGSQVPTTWHWSSAVQVTGVPLVHAPAWHVSFSVQALPSLQPVPFGWFGFEHTPFAGLQVPIE